MAYQFVRAPLEDPDQDRLVAACETPEEKLVVIGLLETGLRVSEFADLRAEQIQWQQRRIKVTGKGGPFGKRSKIRVVPVSDRLRPILEHHFALRDELGISTRTIQRLLKRVANRARITAPVTPHVLRHTFAVNAVRRGSSLSSLQKILGHDRLSTTEIYLNLSPEQVIEEFQRKW